MARWFDAANCPVYINCRDRLNDLLRLVDWLESAGQQRIILVDNDSAYEPLLEYYQRTSHTVLRLGENFGSKSLWRAERVPREWFVFTDPDVLPIERCPINAVQYLHDLLEVHPHAKAGLGLYLDDVPPINSYQWEQSLTAHWREIRLGVYDSQVDTTFALYRPGVPFRLDSALRTGFPYQVRHLPWYHLEQPSEEERFYLARARKGPEGSSWAQGRQ